MVNLIDNVETTEKPPGGGGGRCFLLTTWLVLFLFPGILLFGTTIVMSVEVDDLLDGAALPYITWDCRTVQEHEAGRFSRAAHLNLDGVRFGNTDAAKNDLRQVIAANEPLRHSGTHFCLVGSGEDLEDDADVVPIAYALARNGFR